MEKNSQIYSTLKQYKGSSSSKHTAQLRAAALLARFLRDHQACIEARSRPWDVITHVPSKGGWHSEPHPLVQMMRLYPPIKRQRETLLGPGPGDIARGHGADDAFTATGDVQGRKVLLVDDLWTTGATAQSAASALNIAGGDVVAIVTLGRLIDPDFQGDWWKREQSRLEYDFDTCCLE